MQMMWLFVMLLLILLFVHRSAHAKIAALTTQFDKVQQSVSSNQVTPEDIEHTFERKLRELETRRMEAMKQMREAHQKQQQQQAQASPITFLFGEKRPNLTFNSITPPDAA